MTNQGWKRVEGEELQEAWDENSLSESLEECSAIYMWKKNLRGVPYSLHSSTQIAEWIDELLATPHGLIQDKRLGPFLHVNGIEIRSDALPVPKKNILISWASQKPTNRRWLVQYISALAPYTPALYVGETGNLIARTKKHMDGNTDFGETVKTSCHLKWDHLDLYYYNMGRGGNEDNKLRESIEYITNALTIGGFTKRPG